MIEQESGEFRGIIGEKIRHVLTTFYWLSFNLDPILLPKIASYIGLSREDIQYIKADAIFSILGPWGLKDLKDHFWHDLDFEKFRQVNRRPRKGKEKTVEKVLATYSQPLPAAFLSNKGDMGLLLEPSGEKQIDSSGRDVQVFPKFSLAMGPSQKQAIVRRVEAIKLIRRSLLEGRERKKAGSEATREAIMDILTKSFGEFHFRRVNPLISFAEVYSFFADLKEVFNRERSSEVLEEYAKLFARSIVSFVEFLRKEKKDPLYPGYFERYEMMMMVREMAWGLTSLSSRKSTLHVNEAACEGIEEIKEKFKSMNTSKKDEELEDLKDEALQIFSLRECFPSTSLEWLRRKTGAALSSSIFEVGKEGNSEKVVLRLSEGLSFPFAWESFTWLSLRFPFSDEIIIDEEGFPQLFSIRVSEVRKWVFEHRQVPGILSDFYAVEGKIFPTKPLLT